MNLPSSSSSSSSSPASPSSSSASASPSPGRPPLHRRFVGHIGVVGVAYLVVCVVLLVWAVVVSATDDSGESMAGVIPLLATAPGSFVVLFLPDHVASAFAACALGAGVNAAVIGWCTRTLRRARTGQR